MNTYESDVIDMDAAQMLSTGLTYSTSCDICNELISTTERMHLCNGEDAAPSTEEPNAVDSELKLCDVCRQRYQC